MTFKSTFNSLYLEHEYCCLFSIQQRRAISDQMQMINETNINAEYQKLRKLQRNVVQSLKTKILIVNFA